MADNNKEWHCSMKKNCFFNACSPYSLFFSLYLICRYYDSDFYDNIIIIPSHVTNLACLKENLLKCSCIKDVIVIDTGRDWNWVFTQVKGINIASGSVIHSFGTDLIGFCLLHKVTDDIAFILCDDPVVAPLYTLFIEIDYELYKKQVFGDTPFDFSLIKEAWIIEGRNISNDFLPVKKKYIRFWDDILDKNFHRKLKELFVRVWVLDEWKENCSTALFFDQWHDPFAINGIVLQYVYKQLYRIPDLTIKAHPSEFNASKYNGRKVRLFPKEKSSIPFEVLECVYEENFKNTTVFITEASSSVFNVPFIIPPPAHRAHVYIIFIYKIVSRYSNESNYNIQTKYYSEFLKSNDNVSVYFPESFTELYAILNGIKETAGISENDGKLLPEDLFSEYEDELLFLRRAIADSVEKDEALKLKKHIENLHGDIDGRDELIRSLLEQRDALHKDIDNRDDLIHSLISEREALHKEIEKRDGLIAQLRIE